MKGIPVLFIVSVSLIQTAYSSFDLLLSDPNVSGEVYLSFNPTHHDILFRTDTGSDSTSIYTVSTGGLTEDH